MRNSISRHSEEIVRGILRAEYLTSKLLNLLQCDALHILCYIANQGKLAGITLQAGKRAVPILYGVQIFLYVGYIRTQRAEEIILRNLALSQLHENGVHGRVYLYPVSDHAGTESGECCCVAQAGIGCQTH